MPGIFGKLGNLEKPGDILMQFAAMIPILYARGIAATKCTGNAAVYPLRLKFFVKPVVTSVASQRCLKCGLQIVIFFLSWQTTA